MSRRCDLTGKGVQSGNRVSHSKRRTRHKFLPNIHKKKLWSEKLKRFISIKVSAHALRCIDKLGLDNFAKKMNVTLK